MDDFKKLTEQLLKIYVNAESVTGNGRLSYNPVGECRFRRKPGFGIFDRVSREPGFAVYAATKSYVYSLSMALGRELKGSGIYVTAVCPGPVDTEFFDHTGKEVASVFCRADTGDSAHRAVFRFGE